MCLSPCSHEEWNQMQSQEDEVAVTEQDLELIKERETAIRQLEVRARSCFLFDSTYLHLDFLSAVMRKHEMSRCMIWILCLNIIVMNLNYSYAIGDGAQEYPNLFLSLCIFCGLHMNIQGEQNKTNKYFIVP